MRELSAQGRYHFSTQEAAAALGISLVAARSAIRRLKRKGLVASPYRGFLVIVPPEHHSHGCLPADQFVPQLMDRVGVAYYAGLLTAARYHGAAHQQPQRFQVMVPKNRPQLQCGRVVVDFVARHNTASMPTVDLSTPRGYVRVSTPEANAFDLIGYPQHCGGLDHVATVLSELAEEIDPDRLRSIAGLSPLPWSQRLGFVLDEVGHAATSRPLAGFVAAEVAETVPLSLRHGETEGRRDQRWKLRVNTRLDPDL